MNADEKLAAAGLTDVEVIDHDAFARLPAHKRDVRSVLVQLPDPAPVAALRDIADRSGPAVAGEPDMFERVKAIYRIAERALAEFDGTTT